MADILSMVLGALGLLFLIMGVVFTVWGFFTVMTKKGQFKLGAGIAGLVIAAILISTFGIPALPSASVGTAPPSAGGSWQIYYANANGASLGIGVNPTTANGLKSVTKTQTSPGGFYIYFNATIVAPSGSTQVAYNVVASTGPVQTLTNTSNPTETGPALALRSTGLYDVSITPASGSATYQQQTIPISPGTSKAVAYIVHFSGLTQELSLTQYPITITQTFTFADQTSGASLGSVTLTMTVN